MQYTILLSLSRISQNSLVVLLTQHIFAQTGWQRFSVFWCLQSILTLLANHPSFRKHSDDSIGIRSSYTRWRLLAVHDITIDHQIYTELRNSRTSRLLLLLLFPPPPSRLEADAASSLRAEANDLSQRFDNRLKIPVQWHVLFDYTDLQSVMFLANRFASWSRDFFTFTHINHVRLWRSIDNDWPRYGIANLLNHFLYFPSLISALSLSITRKFFFVTNNRGTTNKFVIRHVGTHMIVVNVFQVDTILFEQA